MELRHNEVLHRAGETIRWAYFPLTAVLGVTKTLRDGSSSELGMIGHEGMAGISTLLGVRSTPFDVRVHVAGVARRLYASTLTEEMGGNTALGAALHLFTSAFLVQLAQGVTCACHHELRQRLVRYLLMVHDRVPCEELPLTHEFLAHMLGVGRPTVTLTLDGLHEAGLVALGRGKITLINRCGLEAATCECYASVRDEYQRLLPTAMPDGHETDRPSTPCAAAMNGRTSTCPTR